MNPAPTRSEAIDLVSTTLLARASRLTRVLLRSGSRELSRTEAGLLTTLVDGPRRITELAESEALAQPTVTQLVDKLERRGLVARERSSADRRVVLISASPEGLERLATLRAEYRAVLRVALEELGDEEVDQLVAATQTLGRLLDKLQAPTAAAPATAAGRA